MRENVADLFITPPPRAPLLTEEEREAIARGVARYRAEGDRMFERVVRPTRFTALPKAEQARRLRLLAREVCRRETVLAAAEASGVPYRLALERVQAWGMREEER